MRVLLLHPDDSINGGVWSRERWDLVVDLGYAGQETYAEWNRVFPRKTVSLYQYSGHIDGYRWVNRVIEQGRRRLLDRAGLDWWDILAMEKYQDLHTLYKLRQLQKDITAAITELAVTRPHSSADLAEQVFGIPLHRFQQAKSGALHRMTRVVESARNLRPAQIAEIALDKWDSEFRLRGYWATRSRAKMDGPCAMVPSAYSNVTRSGLAYAARLRSCNFLLVTTRKNANPSSLPPNVKLASLAAYVRPATETSEENRDLQQQWQAFSRDMQAESEDFRAAAKAGVWDYFSTHLAHGLHLREAWKEVFQSEPVSTVLCGDDLNYHTRLPLIMARSKGMHSVYCSHGALDGGFLFKTPYAESYLVKGEMERDYLQTAAPIGEEQIFVGAPVRRQDPTQSRVADAIIFFSQPYEVIGGRADAIYREIIPRLYASARASGRRLIVKLHPFESKRVRQKFARQALRDVESSEVEFIEGSVPADNVMSRTWCGVTVDSSVAVECALNSIPFFLCGWLDFTGIGYLDQFARYGVAQVLKEPQEIDNIPEMVSQYRPDPAILGRLWCKADTKELENVMFSARRARLKPCAC